MSYDMDLSSMLLGDLELFPECSLSSAFKDEVGDAFSHQPQSQTRGPHSKSTLSIHDDPFPNWLDLKMDLSFLEDLETTDLVLNDLVQSETDVGQSLDALPALQMEDTPFSSLDFKHIPPEQISENADSSQVPCPHKLESDYPAVSPAPSSPECLVPEMITPESPVYLGSLVSSPGSPDYIIPSRITSPAPADTTVFAFVAPLIQPISVLSPAVEVQLDVASWSVVLGDQNENVPAEAQVDIPWIPSPPATKSSAKPKRDYKRKAEGLNKSSGNSKKMKLTSVDDLKPMSKPASKKERKRQQNKDAAMRYRLKKKIETDTMSVEVSELLEHNKQLKEQAQHLATELGYLKKLMREMFKAKGLLK